MSAVPTVRPRILVLCCRGEFQDYLLQRVSEEFDLVGCVRFVPKSPERLGSRLSKYRSPRVLAEYLVARALLPAEDRRGQQLARQLFWRGGVAPAPPANMRELDVDDVNAPEVLQLVRELKPELVLVNGTNLLRRDLLRLASGIRWGFVNLHTGLSPYSRGGNCNLFKFLEGRPEHVGITVHHVDAGIDRGDIILSDQLPLQPGDNFEMSEVRCFHHGIESLLLAARQLIAGRASRVPQWEPGTLYLRRTGYVYRPYHRVIVNRAIRKGLIRDFLSRKEQINQDLRLVGERLP
jgi:folate-dependent phosphoribosylglycinamide formyltransferase PurN